MKAHFHRLFRLLSLVGLLVLGITTRNLAHDLPPERHFHRSLSLGCLLSDDEIERALTRSQAPPRALSASANLTPESAVAWNYSILLENSTCPLARGLRVARQAATQYLTALTTGVRQLETVYHQHTVRNSLLVARPEDALAPRPRIAKSSQVARPPLKKPMFKEPTAELLALGEFLKHVEEVQCEMSSLFLDGQQFMHWRALAYEQINAWRLNNLSKPGLIGLLGSFADHQEKLEGKEVLSQKPLFVEPQFVPYEIADGHSIVLTMAQAEQWQLVRRVSKSSVDRFVFQLVQPIQEFEISNLRRQIENSVQRTLIFLSETIVELSPLPKLADGNESTLR